MNNVSPFSYYTGCWNKYVTFSGRARRSEYWFFVLFNFLIVLGVGIVDGVLGTSGALGGLYNLAILLPSLAVLFRRLHDTGRSGWWWLLLLIPFIGWVIIIIFACIDSQPGENEYGPNPKG